MRDSPTQRRQRLLRAAAGGAAFGFLAGLVLDAVIGAIGLFGMHRLIGVRFLPLATAVLGALIALGLRAHNSFDR